MVDDVRKRDSLSRVGEALNGVSVMEPFEYVILEMQADAG
jgi:hypothetical protein